jgi:hypothetical protein
MTIKVKVINGRDHIIEVEDGYLGPRASPGDSVRCKSMEVHP